MLLDEVRVGQKVVPFQKTYNLAANYDFERWKDEDPKSYAFLLNHGYLYVTLKDADGLNRLHLHWSNDGVSHGYNFRADDVILFGIQQKIEVDD